MDTTREKLMRLPADLQNARAAYGHRNAEGRLIAQSYEEMGRMLGVGWQTARSWCKGLSVPSMAHYAALEEYIARAPKK